MDFPVIDTRTIAGQTQAHDLPPQTLRRMQR
jgi:hypothetical protein